MSFLAQFPELSGRRTGCQLQRYVIDRLDGAFHMDVLIRRIHFHPDASVVSAYHYVLIPALHFNECRFRVFHEFFCHGMHQRHVTPGALLRSHQMARRHKVHGHRHHSRRRPYMDMRSIRANFIHVHANHALVKCIRRCHRDRRSEPQSDFSQQHHFENPFPCRPAARHSSRLNPRQCDLYSPWLFESTQTRTVLSSSVTETSSISPCAARTCRAATTSSSSLSAESSASTTFMGTLTSTLESLRFLSVTCTSSCPCFFATLMSASFFCTVTNSPSFAVRTASSSARTSTPSHSTLPMRTFPLCRRS